MRAESGSAGPSRARRETPSIPRASPFEAAALHIQHRPPSRSRAPLLHSPPTSLQLFTFSLTLPPYHRFFPPLRRLSVSPRRPFFPALFDASPRGPLLPSSLLAWIIIFNNVSEYFCPAVKVKARKVGAKNGGDGAQSFRWTRWCVRGIGWCGREVTTLFI